MRQAELTVELAECETIVIVVDGFGPSDHGDVRLSVSGREEVCDDGMDGDADGLVDCEDLDDCGGPECVEPVEWPGAWAELEQDVLALTNQRRARGASCGDEVFGSTGPRWRGTKPSAWPLVCTARTWARSATSSTRASTGGPPPSV